MNPTTHYFPRDFHGARDLGEDAFFASDRSLTSVLRTIQVCELQPGRRFPMDKDSCGNPITAVIPGFRNRFAASTYEYTNPLQHARKRTRQDRFPDPEIRSWTHNVNYTSIASSSASVLTTIGNTKRLRVSILFGTGTEATRHGVGLFALEAPEPALLIIVEGIEPEYLITFFNPANPGIMTAPPESRELLANNRWGAGINEVIIKNIISHHFGRPVDYDIVVCAAFSTGYLGLYGVISNNLIPIQSLERVIIYDCLYSLLGQPLSYVKRAKPTVEIICYVATGRGGNDYLPQQPERIRNLVLGNIPGWRYIDLISNPAYHTLASSRVIDQARSHENPIITQLPVDFERILNDVTTRLPSRGTVVSDPGIYKKVRGSIPSTKVTLMEFGIANGNRIGLWFGQITTVRQCLGNAELLGWPSPPGEEWHDMILIEFAWEYLI